MQRHDRDLKKIFGDVVINNLTTVEMDEDVKHLEFEFRLGTYEKKNFIPGQTLNQFDIICKNLQKFGYHVESEISLDIKLDTDDRRLTIKHLNNVKNLCRFEKFSNIKATDIECITKSKGIRVDMPNYRLRFQLSKEIPIIEETQIQQLKDDLADGENKKFYRYKQRYSFTRSDSKLRFDLTVVKSGDGTSFKKSMVLMKPEIYEVEAEYIGNVGKINKVADILDDHTISEIYSLLKWSQNSFTVLRTTEQSDVFEEYSRVSKCECFISMDVLPLTVDKLSVIKQKYSVTEKADGEHNLLFVSRDKFPGEMYLINNRLEIKHTGLKTDNPLLYGSIFDGELVETTSKTHKFLIFDCLFLNMIDMRSKKLLDINKKKLKKGEGVADISSRHMAMLWCNDLFKHLPTVAPDVNLGIGFKNYEFDTDTNILQLAKTVYTNKYDYQLDGLIFTPYDEAYPEAKLEGGEKFSRVKWDGLLKWKPISQLSIDFWVELLSKKPMTDEISGKSYVEARLKVYTIDKFARDPTKRDRLVDFMFDPKDSQSNVIRLYTSEEIPHSKDGNVIYHESVVEFIYNEDYPAGYKWVPLRIRPDKTQNKKPNSYKVAKSTWDLIQHPVTFEVISGQKIVEEAEISTEIKESDDRYYKQIGSEKSYLVENLKDYHGAVKYLLFDRIIKDIRRTYHDKNELSLLDIACGQGGDLHRWGKNTIDYVLGVEFDKMNLLDEKRGAIQRYSSFKYQYPDTKIDFIWGDSRQSIIDGEAGLDMDNKRILKNIMSSRGPLSFDIVSCQFAFHYFLENIETLENVLRNVSSNLKIGGYFFGTTLDGKKVFDQLKDVDTMLGEKPDIKREDKHNERIWEITKSYNGEQLEPLGQRIDVYNVSIGKTIPEYLVNYEYLVQIAKNFGLTLIKDGELTDLKGVQSFEDIYGLIINESKKTKSKSLASIMNMSLDEKKYSFMNNYFIFKKIQTTIQKPQIKKKVEIKKVVIKK